MTINTNRFGFPTPEDSDTPDGPAELQALAEPIEDRLGYAGAQGGKSIIDAEQTRNVASYAELGTPDRVSGINIPRDGDLLYVMYSALWKPSSGVGGTGIMNAALFIGANQLKTIDRDDAPFVQAADGSGATGGIYGWLWSTADGLTAGSTVGPGASDVATGLIAAQPFVVERLAAGTYDVSVQFKMGGGATVSVKQRRLYAWTREFPASGI